MIPAWLALKHDVVTLGDATRGISKDPNGNYMVLNPKGVAAWWFERMTGKTICYGSALLTVAGPEVLAPDRRGR